MLRLGGIVGANRAGNSERGEEKRMMVRGEKRKKSNERAFL